MAMDHRAYLGREGFPQGLGASEVAQFFSLSEDELHAVRTHRRALNRLDVALQIGYLRLTGTALNSFEIIPPQVLAHLGGELGVEVPRLTSIRALYRRRRTLFEHHAAAKSALGLRNITLHGEWALGGFLRREAGVRIARDELVSAAPIGWSSITICNCRSGGSLDRQRQRGAVPRPGYWRWRSGRLTRSRAKPGPTSCWR